MNLKHRKLNHTRKSEGFTLIELLVVIAIIAVIAAILFPVFASAREKARQTTCTSNLKQIGLMFLQYEQDFDEMTPYAYNTAGSSTGQPPRSWDQELQQYSGTNKAVSSGFNGPSVFTCPDDNIPRGGTIDARSYAMVRARGNGIASEPATGTTYSPGRLLSTIPDVAGTFMLVEWPTQYNILGSYEDAVVDTPDMPLGLTGNANYFGQDCTGQLTSSSGNCATQQPPVHTGGWNYLYVDGHVKWYRPEETIGSGDGGTGKGVYVTNGASFTCSYSSMCGPWTVDPND